MSEIFSNPSFVVSFVSPLVFDNQTTEITVCGYSLSEVKKCVYKNRAQELELQYKKVSEDCIILDVSSIQESNSMFFVFLYDEKSAIQPIGPFIKITDTTKSLTIPNN